MSFNNRINILRAMSITTVFAIAATVTMVPDGFDMSACTLASCSAYVFVSMYLWYGLPLIACVLITIAVTLVMYQLTMFLILVCKISDMLATCALMFVHQGLGQWYIGGGAQTVTEALIDVVGKTGTIMMPTQSWKIRQKHIPALSRCACKISREAHLYRTQRRT